MGNRALGNAVQAKDGADEASPGNERACASVWNLIQGFSSHAP